MERGSRKRSATTAGQTRSAGGAANAIPDGTAGPWVIDGLPITIYPPTESNRYYQIVWYEEGRRRTTSAGTSHRKAEIKADTIARRLVAQAFASERPVKDLVEAWLSPN